MLDMLHLPSSQLADVQVFDGNSSTNAVGWTVWQKRRGVSMVAIYAWGPGGAGGNGAVGAASTAAGGGGGGSGGQSMLIIPAFCLPDFLYINVGMNAGAFTRVSLDTVNNAQNMLLVVAAGSAGGNATGATAGAAGAAAGGGTLSGNPIAGLGHTQFLAGQAGIIGGTTVAGAALTIPTSGLMVTGGTGGGGLPAAAAVGTSGGAFTVTGIFPQQPGGIGAAAATTPGGNGSHGISGFKGLAFDYGGTGGGSSHGSATGAGLVGGMGGRGGIGSGGGGGGGALTGSVQGLGGPGGPGQVLICAW